ncbi:MAG: hypothetical protein AAFQ37_08730 [Bacteroidota bacterium]
MEQSAIDLLRQLITQGELGLTIEQLQEKITDERYRPSVLIMAARYGSYKKDLLAGVLSAEDSELRSNRLSQTVLQLLEHIEAGKPFQLGAEAGEKGITNINIVQGKNIVTGDINTSGGDLRIGDNHEE